MAADYIPTQDALAAEWFRVFAQGIAADPEWYGLSADDSDLISGVVEAFRAALAVATRPDERTVVSVLAKNQARAEATRVCRGYAQRIKADENVPSTAKLEIGVRPLNRKRTKIDLPKSVPAIAVIAATPNRHLLRFKDTASPDKRAKPVGAVALQLFVHVGDGPAPAEGWRDARYCGTFTKNPVRVEYTHADGGKKATYFGRWVSRRGEEGPFSISQGMHIAA